MQIGGHALVARPGQRPFGFGNDNADKIGPLVTIDHRLGDLVLQGQHAFDALRSDIVALVVDDDVLLAVGDDEMAVLVEMADVAGVEPAVLQHAMAFGVVHPIAVHHQFAAYQYLAVAGDPDLDTIERRANSVHLEPRARAVAADHRPGLGLAIALQDGDADGGEENADFGVERRAAGHHALQPAAEFGADRFANSAF